MVSSQSGVSGRVSRKVAAGGLLLLAVLVALAESRSACAATFTVTTTDDTSDGTCNAAHCSLREALTAAQAGGPHTIAFNIPGAGVRTITVATCLPGVAQAVTIDGYTQPGSSPNTNATGAINAVPLIELKGGPSCGTGLSVVFGSASLAVRGLILNGFSATALAATQSSLTVEGCFIGTTADGMTAATGPSFDSGGNGITAAASSLVVGGTTPAARNLISGNRYGISHGNSGTSLVQGNLIGTNKLGTAAVPNGYGYVSLADCNGGSVTSQIGGASAAARNVISGNGWEAVSLGNSAGVGCSGFLASNSFVRGNYIGTDVTGTQPLGNGWSGRPAIHVANGPNVFIGGAAPGEGNVIAHNTLQGVVVQQSFLTSTDGIRVLGNSIFANGGMGIDLQGTTGATPNDAGDVDLRLQNFPVITGVSPSGGSTTITGTVDSQAGKTYRVELFVNDLADGTSHGEGQTLLGTTTVTTNASGAGAFSVGVPVAVANTQFVTATATDPDGNTSEFSRLEADLVVTNADAPDPVGVNQDVTHTLTVTNSASSVFPSAPVTLTYTRAADATVVNNGGGTVSGNTIAFDVGMLTVGASATRTVVVRYASPGSKTSTAAATSTIIDPSPGNNSASATTTVSATPPLVTITGTVRTGVNTVLPGVTLTLSGSASRTTTSAANGTYTFTNLTPGGTYTVTPGLAGRVFEPPSRTFAAMTVNQTADFVGRLIFTISGQVRDRNDTGVAGVTMTLTETGAPNRTLSTDVEGRYAFTGLTAGRDYAVTPSKDTFVFTPASQTFPNLSKDEVAGFFIAEVGTFTRYFAEGATSDFFDTQIALLNATGQPATATVRFQQTTGAEVVTTVPLTGLQRVTVDPKTLGLTESEFSTVIESTQPVIADRTMTWDGSGYGSHAETSIGRPLTQWFLAEGATIDGFDLFYLIQNPNDAAADVTVRYLLRPPAAPIEKTYTVGPRSRFNIWVNTEDPALDEAELSAAVTVTNGIPVIVERAMYRPVAGQTFGAGHESAGVEAPALQWFFAEGATGQFFDLFFLVANPGDQASTVEARFLKPDGTVVTRTYDVPGNSRFNIWVDFEGAELSDTAVATTFRVTNGRPVVIERAMWWAGDVGNWYEGHNTAGAVVTGEKWGLAAGEVGGPFELETYILIGNTSLTEGTARVTLTFEDGTQAVREYVLPPSSRTNVAVGEEFPEAADRRFGAVVESVGPALVQLMVERAMYSNAGGVVWAAGTSAFGTKLR